MLRDDARHDAGEVAGDVAVRRERLLETLAVDLTQQVELQRRALLLVMANLVMGGRG